MKIAPLALAMVLVGPLPAYAEWTTLIRDSSDSIRLAMAVGFGQEDDQRQFVTTCVAVDGDVSGAPSLSIALPRTGEYSVRVGADARIEIASGSRSWAVDATVETNDSSGFLADAETSAALEIMRTMAEQPADLMVRLVSGPVESELRIAPDEALEAARQFLDVCGAR